MPNTGEKFLAMCVKIHVTVENALPTLNYQEMEPIYQVSEVFPVDFVTVAAHSVYLAGCVIYGVLRQ